MTEELQTVRNEVRDSLKKAHDRLRASISKVSRDIERDVRELNIQYCSTDGQGRRVIYPLYRGSWVTTLGGLQMMLIDDVPDCRKLDLCKIQGCPHALCSADDPEAGSTRVLCSGHVHVPAHKHQYSEWIQVLKGTLLDLKNGRVYHVGDTLFYDAGEEHEVELNGMLMVCWKPPLAQLSEIGSDSSLLLKTGEVGA